MKKIKTCVSRRQILNFDDKYMFDPGGCSVISEIYPCWVHAMYYRYRRISQGFFLRGGWMDAGGGGGGLIVILGIDSGGGTVTDDFE